MKRAGILAFALWLCSGFSQATELAFLSLSDLQQVKQQLARTRSFHYSYFNLQALTALAQLAQKSGNGDLWHYQNAQGGSLLAALASLAPYSDPVKPWPWKNRDRVSQRIIPLLSLADNSLHQTRWESAIAHTDWTAFSGSARGAVGQAQRDTWLISLPYGQKKGQQ